MLQNLVNFRSFSFNSTFTDLNSEQKAKKTSTQTKTARLFWSAQRPNERMEIANIQTQKPLESMVCCVHADCYEFSRSCVSALAICVHLHSPHGIRFRPPNDEIDRNRKSAVAYWFSCSHFTKCGIIRNAVTVRAMKIVGNGKKQACTRAPIGWKMFVEFLSSIAQRPFSLHCLSLCICVAQATYRLASVCAHWTYLERQIIDPLLIVCH